MKHPHINALISSAILAVGLLAGSTALAKKTISLKLHNQTSSTKMTCSVHKVVTNTQGQDIETLLKKYNVKPKNQRSAAYRDRPQSFSLGVKYIVKRLDGSVVYPRLKLTCELEGQNSKNHSPLWDHRSQSFSRFRFVGSCRSGAYCSARVDRR